MPQRTPPLVNVRNLSLPAKLVKGQDFLTMGADNPNVPGNAPLIAELQAQQTALAAANAAYEEAQRRCKELLSARNDLQSSWYAAVMGLSAYTESKTGGDATKILSAGFDVKAPPSPPQPVSQVMNVRVDFTGEPGYSEVRWKRDPHADAYIVECSPDPITDTSWRNLGVATEVKYVGNGATPGQRCWFRVSAVNRAGRGPWSEPALRPVM